MKYRYTIGKAIAHCFTVAAALLFVLADCSSNPTMAGGTSTTGNAKVLGAVYNGDGTPASGAYVTIVPEGYSPVADEPLADSHRDTTGSDGTWAVEIDSGTYNIEAHLPDSGTRLTVWSVATEEESTRVAGDTLRLPVTVQVALSDSVEAGYLYLPGTTRKQPVVVAGTAQLDSVSAGDLPRLVYRSVDGHEVELGSDLTTAPGDTLWLGEGARPAADTAFFSFGFFDKQQDSTLEETELDAYYRQMFDLTDQYGFNTVVAPPYTEVQQRLDLFDIAELRGLNVVMTVVNPLNPLEDPPGPSSAFDPAYTHAAVTTIKYGHWPEQSEFASYAEMYTEIERYYANPVVTVLNGERMAPGGGAAASFWQTVGSDIRLASYNAVRGSGGVSVAAPGAPLDYREYCAQMDTLAQTPWWAVIQAFGDTLDGDTSYTLPTAAEVSIMAHLALANGARGLLFWSLQPDRPERVALASQELAVSTAADGSVPLFMCGVLRTCIDSASGVLSRHIRDPLVITAGDPAVAASVRRDPVTGEKLVYVVNTDPAQTVSTTVEWTAAWTTRRGRDLYSGSEQAVVSDGMHRRMAVLLAPGEGQLFRLEP